jgi:hypothetical protein
MARLLECPTCGCPGVAVGGKNRECLSARMLELLRECAKHEIHCAPLLASMLKLIDEIDGKEGT